MIVQWRWSTGWLTFALGTVNTNAQSFNNERQDDEAKEQDIEFVEPAKNAAISFEPAK